jgi:hypothetical protein
MSLVSLHDQHAQVSAPRVAAPPASINRRPHGVHYAGVAAVVGAGGLAAILLMHALTASVYVGSGPDLTQPPLTVDNRPVGNVGGVNCDRVGNCLTR